MKYQSPFVDIKVLSKIPGTYCSKISEDVLTKKGNGTQFECPNAYIEQEKYYTNCRIDNTLCIFRGHLELNLPPLNRN